MRATVLFVVGLAGCLCGPGPTAECPSGPCGGGSTGGGLVVMGGGSSGGGDAGVPIELSLAFGELCNPALYDEILTTCRVSVFNPYSAARCISARSADGGTLTRAEQTALIGQGEPEACSLFGAARLRCTSSSLSDCAAARRDGGLSSEVFLRAQRSCDLVLGNRFDDACSSACTTAYDGCTSGCGRIVAEPCASCFMACGREYARCVRPCLVLPDAGYPDAG